MNLKISRKRQLDDARARRVCRAEWRLIAVLLLFSLAAHAFAAAQFPAAGRVGLQPPPGMVVSGNFAGFEDRSETASILIAEMPAAAYASLDQGFTAPALAKKGITDTRRRDWPVTGAKAFLIRGTQAAGNLAFAKWLLVVGNDDLTAVITTQVREESAAYPSAAIEAALHTIAFRPAVGLEAQIAALPFRVADRAGFRTERVLAGSLLMLTEGPKDISGPEQPAIGVGWGLDVPPSPATRDAFARNGLATLTTIRQARIERTQAREHDVHELEATALDAKSGETVHIIQIIRFLPRGWIRTVGIVRASDKDRFTERIRRVAASVEPR